ncbi:SLAF1 protein, partial [Thryothorus ludovicianus]|nr:SLAF1 protein [Thryothorus ludovicianus]
LEKSGRKKFLVKIHGGNFTQHDKERLRFHPRNFSLEILETSRADTGIYEFSVITSKEEEETFQIQLRVLEAVADPSILILGREWSGGRCSLALRCSAARGDEVSFTWGGADPSLGPGGDPGPDPGSGPGSGSGPGPGPDPPCSGTGPSLNLSFSGREPSPGCVCTARNAVSSGSAALEPAGCG